MANIKIVDVALQPQGFPGIQQALTGPTANFDLRHQSNSPDYRGVPGRYRAVFTLSRPGFPLLKEYELSDAAGLMGDSHLAITAEAHEAAGHLNGQLLIQTATLGGPVKFTGSPNDEGFLAKFEGEFDANDFIDAQRVGFKALAPCLSSWSIQLDVPLHIFQLDLTEIVSGVRRIIFVPPFHSTPMLVSQKPAADLELQGYGSLYREALASNSPVYQFLCFFKIVERIRERRSSAAGEAKGRGQSIGRLLYERFPKGVAELNSWLDSLYVVRPIASWDIMVTRPLLRQEIAGKKFGYIFEKELLPLRIQIAHAIFDTGEIGLSVDDYLSHEAVAKWLPVLKLMVRRMIKNEFPAEFLVLQPDP